MYPIWKRGLTTCLQHIVRDGDDVEVDAGEVAVGELRRRAFTELQKALSDAQVLALGWLALADVAVWPQLIGTDARALADSIETTTPTLPLDAAGARSLRGASYRATAVILAFIAHAQARVKYPQHAPRVDFEPLRMAINAIAHFREAPVVYWEQWLRRVVETAAVTPHEECCALAREALRSTLNAPARFEYEANRTNSSLEPNTNGPFEVTMVEPHQGGRVVGPVGVLTDLDPIKRKVSANFTPAVVVDRYRMAYLLRSVCMAELLDDAKSGYFDTVTCTNTRSGETWSYVRV